jgi:hypothetical protein
MGRGWRKKSPMYSQHANNSSPSTVYTHILQFANAISKITPLGPLCKTPKSPFKRFFATAGLYTYIHYMKRLLRILFGLPLCPLPMLLGTWVWMWTDDDESWLQGPGQLTWYIASGQWDKLED